MKPLLLFARIYDTGSMPAALFVSIYESNGAPRGGFSTEVVPYSGTPLGDVFRQLDGTMIEIAGNAAVPEAEQAASRRPGARRSPLSRRGRRRSEPQGDLT